MIRAIALLALVGLAACVAPGTAPAPAAPALMARPAPAPDDLSVGDVIARVEPVAEAICRARVRGRNCDFAIAVDDRPGQPPNAFQTLDERGRPYVVFTLSLLEEVANPDELAFVLGHEAAHHIAGHIPKRQDRAMSGAILAGAIAEASGLSPEEVRAAQGLGAEIAARQYSQEFELEADALGAEIALAAGFDPVRGAAFFARLPDPGDAFLSTHPPNAARRAVVAETVARLTGG